MTDFSTDAELGICDDGYAYTRIVNGVVYTAVTDEELLDIITDD